MYSVQLASLDSTHPGQEACGAVPPSPGSVAHAFADVAPSTSAAPRLGSPGPVPVVISPPALPVAVAEPCPSR